MEKWGKKGEIKRADIPSKKWAKKYRMGRKKTRLERKPIEI
jgi:hypothetical protein